MTALLQPVGWSGDAPSPPPPCPECGGKMGDNDRVLHNRCGACLHGLSTPRCWCGRRLPRFTDRVECAEHDDPIPEVSTGPSDPLTPGGVFDRRYP